MLQFVVLVLLEKLKKLYTKMAFYLMEIWCDSISYTKIHKNFFFWEERNILVTNSETDKIKKIS